MSLSPRAFTIRLVIIDNMSGWTLVCLVYLWAHEAQSVIGGGWKKRFSYKHTAKGGIYIHSLSFSLVGMKNCLHILTGMDKLNDHGRYCWCFEHPKVAFLSCSQQWSSLFDVWIKLGWEMCITPSSFILNLADRLHLEFVLSLMRNITERLEVGYSEVLY